MMCRGVAGVFCITFLLVITVLSHAEPNELQLTFVGDIMAHDVNYRMQNFSLIYERVKEYFTNDDLTFGNLEFPVVDDLPFSTYPAFNVHRSYVEAALAASFEVFSIANNHSLDKGKTGVLKTLGSLLMLKEGAGGRMYYSGIRGDTSRSFTPTVIRENGFRIGFLAVTQFLNLPQPSPYIYVVDYTNPAIRARFLEEIRSLTPRFDLFILSFHGDAEYQLSPHPEKRAFFRELLEAGVGIIWGHHPHVFQPYEIVTVDGTQRLIMYSMGNFVSGQGYHGKPGDAGDRWAYTGDSVLLRVRVTKTPHGVNVVSAEPVLIALYTTPTRDIVVDRLDRLAAAPIDPSWREYYRKRLGIMTHFLENMDTYLQ
ncbi:MAG TPA: CapA family protein [Spirochaetia bacterium]|mgnify:CR=1 FL=1|nr:CapA family protein [Spirochaetia bacterium]